MSALLEAPVHAAADEEQDIERLRGRIDDIYSHEGKALLISADTNIEAVELPASAFDALRRVVEAMSQGQTIVLMPFGKELTTQQAADMLHVSRPYVTKLCDAGDLAFHRVGTHRRIRIEDVLAYLEQRANERQRHLRELTQLSEELEGGYR